MRRKTKTHVSKNLPWSEAEDQCLIRYISESGGNIREAFRRFSEEFPIRTYCACEKRWYLVLRKRNSNTCFMILDKKHKHVNSKNIKTPISTHKMKVSLWKKILNILGL